MFIKLVANPSASNSATAWKEWTETIGNILDGTWTSTSSLSTTYFNQGACQIIGSKPTTNDGTDSFTSINTGTNTSNSSDNYIQFKFNHAERSASYSYSSDHKLWVTATGTYGLRFRAGNGTGGNLQPYNSTSYYSVTTDANRKYHPNWPQETTLIWANKHSFVIQIYNGNYMTTLGTFGYDASAANEYQYDTIGSNAHGPFVSMGSHMRTSIWNTPNGDSTTYEEFWVGASTYLNPAQSVQAFTNRSGSWHRGVNFNDNQFYMALNPLPVRNVYPLRTSTGHIHQLIPVYADPHFNHDTASYPFNGRMKTLYRTTDDIAAPGSLITHDGTQYAVWNVYKTGSSWGSANNIQNMCYLIPTTVGGN